MKEYGLTFWEKQIVWNKRYVVVKTDKDPLTLTIDDIDGPSHEGFDIEWGDVLDTIYDGVEEIMDIEIVGNNKHHIQEEE